MNGTSTITYSHRSATADSDTLGGLFQHNSRPEWGLATRVAQRESNISFQFEDGKLRKIARDFLHLLTPIDRPFDQSERLQRALAHKAGLTLARNEHRGSGDPLVTLEQQLALFTTDFPFGFSDADYRKKYRGVGKRRAKKHRDSAIAHARLLLRRTELMQLMLNLDHVTIMGRVAEVLAKTSLVNKRQLEPLAALDDDGMRRAASALSQLLYGDVDIAVAMQAWINALATAGKGVTWQLATALPALLQPNNHLCVSPTVIEHQARWMSPRLGMSKMPNGKLYARVRVMALRITEELEGHGHAPTDLLDVHDFVWLTLRPAARKRIATMPTPTAVLRPETSSEGCPEAA